MAEAITEAAVTTATTAAATITAAAKPWYDGADAALVAHMTTHGWDKKTEKEVALAAAQSHMAAAKLIGIPPDEVVRVPKTPTADGWDKVYEKLGVPKEYKFEGLKFADGTAPDQGFLDFVTKNSVDLHLTQAGATELATRLMRQIDGDEAAAKLESDTKRAADVASLRQAWGPDWDAHMFIAQRAAASLGVTKEQLEAAQSTLGYGKVMDMFRQIGRKTGEDAFVAGGVDADGKRTLMTRDQAINKKAELMADSAWAQRYTAGGKKELAEMMAVSTIISGVGARAA